MHGALRPVIAVMCILPRCQKAVPEQELSLLVHTSAGDVEELGKHGGVAANLNLLQG